MREGKTMMMRDWTWIEATAETTCPVRVARIDALAGEWNAIERRIAARDAFACEFGGRTDAELDEDWEWDARLRSCRRASGDAVACKKCIEAGNVTLDACEHLTVQQIGDVLAAYRQESADALAAYEARPLIEQGLIEDQLEALGARLMRPYEHHREHEAYYQYAESCTY